MGIVSYVDDVSLMGEAFLNGNYTNINQQKDRCTFRLDRGSSSCGYNINKNIPLSTLYKKDFYTVKFNFVNIETIHENYQEMMVLDMCNMLKKELQQIKGYFILRVPTHVVDLIRAINSCFEKKNFCGGTVHYIQNKTDTIIQQSTDKFFYILEEKNKNRLREKLTMIAEESFKHYQSQYHISPYTSAHAEKIYKNWIQNSIDNTSKDKILVGEFHSQIASFYSFSEDHEFVEGILTAVHSDFRNQGLYKDMLKYLMCYAQEKGKYFVTSTQMDNFITQSVWGTLGLKLYFSIYNFHIEYS